MQLTIRNTSRLHFTSTLGSMMMLGFMLFLCTTYVYAGQVSLAWDANTESKLGGYQLYYGQASGNYTANVDVGNKTSYTLGSLREGKTYYFAVRAYAIGKLIWSDFSNEIRKTIPTSLVAAYNFKEASGTTVVDASGKRNHGIISGASRITQGRFGKALSFDGVNDWVTVKDTASLDLTTGMTLEAWVFPTTSSGTRDILLKEGTGVDIYNLYARNWRGLPEANIFLGGINRTAEEGGAALAPDVWTHLAGTFDGTSLWLFVNGTEVARTPMSGLITTSAGPLRIGGNSLWGEFFEGRIDEIRVYNRALSAAEIKTDMNTAVASSSPPISFIGTNTVGPISDSLPARQAYAFQNIAAKTGKVTSLSVYVDAGSAATDLVVGIYSNNNSHPYKLLGKSTLTNPRKGKWNHVVLPAISVRSGTQYWIAILSANTGILRFRDAAAVTAQPSETSNQTTLTTLPSTWSTGTVYNEGPLSAYGAGYP